MKFKGRLAKKRPFPIRGQGTKNMCITIHESTNATAGDLYYEITLDNGKIFL